MSQTSQIYQSNNSDQRNPSRSRSRDRQKKSRSPLEKRGRPSKKCVQNSISIQNEQIDEQIFDSEYKQLRQYESSLPDDKNRTAFQMMEAFLTFFYQIGQQKGMVFDQMQRKQFIQKAKKDKNQRIKWSNRHQWDPKKQAQKLANTARLCNIDLQKQEMKHFFDTLLQTSGLFAQEFTDQLYKFLLNIWLIGRKQSSIQEIKETEFSSSNQNKEQNESKPNIKVSRDDKNKEIKQSLFQLAKKVCNNENGQYYCLSFQFKTIKDRSKKGNKNIPKEKRVEAYKNLVTSIHKSYNKL